MKGKFLLPLLLLFTLNANSQKKTVKIFEDQVGPISVKYDKSIDLSSADTAYSLIFLFQNVKYTNISDISVIGFFNNINLQEFIKDLNIAVKEKETDEKVAINWEKKYYKITLYDFSKLIFLTEGGTGSAYTRISIKQAQKLLSVLKRIQIGNDMILPE